MAIDHGSLAFGGVQRSYSFGFYHADMIPNSLIAVVCPEMDCEQVQLQNDPGSTGNITIGGARLAVTGAGRVLQPGEVTGWYPLKNLNLIWHKDSAGSTLNYEIFR
jgi:hypothetical protein